MDICLVIKQRLEELGLEQRDLAAAAEVTESYISQLLTRKKLPPEPGRTDIYDKIGKFLKLPGGKLANQHPRVPGRGCLQRVSRELRFLPESADRILGYRSRNLRDGNRF